MIDPPCVVARAAGLRLSVDGRAHDAAARRLANLLGWGEIAGVALNGEEWLWIPLADAMRC